MYDRVPPSIMEEFHKYDVDSSGFIDPQEFVNIAMNLNLDANAVSLSPQSLYPADLLFIY